MAGLRDPALDAVSRIELVREILEQRSRRGVYELPVREFGNGLGGLTEALATAGFMKREEGFQKMHMRVLPPNAIVHDLTLAKSARWMFPLGLELVEQHFRGIEKVF